MTGANFFLDTGEKNVLIDCGLLQGVPGAEGVNAEQFDYDPSTIDYVFVTHAHIDHIGKIPKLVKDGFRGTVYSTEETREIARLMLEDMAHIADSNARRDGTLPLYGLKEVEKAFGQWKVLEYHQKHDFEGFAVELFDAGHILGSAMYKFIFPSGRSMLFTGDTGNSPSPLLPDTEVVTGIEYMLMDSVYGDRNHESPETRDQKFKEAVLEAVQRGGTLVIPVFSLERTQIILYELNKLFGQGIVPSVPVFLDSPLAIRVTEIYERVSRYYKQSVQAEITRERDGSIFDFPRLKETAQVRDSYEIENVHGPKIVLAGSGMSTAGRVLDHEARYLPDPNATILFIGYQAPGTLGRLIQEGAKKVTIKGVSVESRAHIVTIGGFSAHRDSDHLVEFVSHAKDTLKRVFVTMGEPKAALYLAQRLRDELGVSAVVPKRGEPVELDL